jgi:hypothetical protein
VGITMAVSMAVVGRSTSLMATALSDETLESQADPWQYLRDLSRQLAPGETVTILFGKLNSGYRLRPQSVRDLVRLNRFEPQSLQWTNGSYQLTAVRVDADADEFTATILVPCRNELDNIDALVASAPALGTWTELLFVDGASTDGTVARIQQLAEKQPGRNIKLIEQSGNTGKGGATFQGLEAARGDIIVVWDADMTVPGSQLERFCLALAENVTCVANGTRLVLPMASGAMPKLNQFGNRVFAAYMSWLVRQPMTDTLCGTKSMRRSDVPAIVAQRPAFGGHDPWGDFDLLLSAAACGLRVLDVPVVYAARVAGDSKMRPLRHGMALWRSALAGARQRKRFASIGPARSKPVGDTPA